MPIYTRTGDKGKTGLFDGKRVSKDSLLIEAIGTVDELNAVFGLVIAKVSSSKYQVLSIKKELEKIQSDLFTIGALLANPRNESSVDFEKRAKEFETLIDTYTKKLPRLFNFILPGGGEAGSSLHLARTVSRRVERRIVTLSKKSKLDKGILIYINRLSDLLFTMARFVNLKEHKKETIWKNG